MVKTISLALGCRSGRIQFVPDMLPSDIIDMKIFNQKTGDFELRQGPVMTALLLADEINRAIRRQLFQQCRRRVSDRKKPNR